MAGKFYWVTFGSGDQRINTGLTPTFLLFFDQTSTGFTPPHIAEIKTGSGAYGFTMSLASTLSIFFEIYAGTTLTNPTDSFVKGVVDPILTIDQQAATGFSAVIAQGLSLSSVISGTSGVVPGILALQAAIGTTMDSYGNTMTDPGTIYGYLKRNLEFNEGDAVFTASTGVWQIYNRTALGATTLLRQKTLLNNVTVVNKSGL